jgi:hypothetical protein
MFFGGHKKFEVDYVSWARCEEHNAEAMFWRLGMTSRTY